MSSQMHPLGYKSKTAQLPTGYHYRYVDVHPPKGVKTIATALLMHGFPDAAYGWRHQVKGWSNRGIRLIISDALGYNGSSQPLDAEEYNLKRQSDNYEALITHIGLPGDEKVVLIAHDWGAITAIRLAQYKPNLVKGIASIGIPFSFAKPAPAYVPTEQLAEMFPTLGYQLFFESPEAAAVLDAKTERFMSLLFVSGRQFESGEVPNILHKGVIEEWLKDDTKLVDSELLSRDELEVMIKEIKSGVGFSAMLNYYQNGKRNFELERGLPQNYRPEIPKLLVIAPEDIALPPQFVENAENDCENLEVVRLKGPCGHWIQLEMPQKLEEAVGDWVERMSAKGWAV